MGVGYGQRTVTEPEATAPPFAKMVTEYAPGSVVEGKMMPPEAPEVELGVLEKPASPPFRRQLVVTLTPADEPL